MKLRHSVCALSAVALIAACAAQTTQDVIHTAPDAAQCIESAVMSFVSGVPDVAGLIAHCGATVSDIEKVISDLKNKSTVDGGVSASPESAAKIAAWENAVVDYKAAHPGAK